MKTPALLEIFLPDGLPPYRILPRRDKTRSRSNSNWSLYQGETLRRIALSWSRVLYPPPNFKP